MCEDFGGFGISGAPYLIFTPEDMNAIGAHPEDWDKYFRLIADIDLSAYTDTQLNIIGSQDIPFTGVFDGNGHTISNFTYSSTRTDYIGLFGYLKGINAEIRDLGLTDPNIHIGGDVFCTGSLVGRLYKGRIFDCHVEGGSISGHENVGGLVGGTVDPCSTITKCYSNSIVSGTDQCVGGLVGSNKGFVSRCYSNGIVWGDYRTGGLAGMNRQGIISESYSTASVSGDDHVGGLVGENYYNWYGNQAVITNCYSTGSVLGDERVGGLVGMNYCSKISNCYSIGYIDANLAGGLVSSTGGCLAAICSSSFWDKQASQFPFSYQGTGKTTAEMMQEATFTNWDFVDVWKICEGRNYPKLAWQIPIPGDLLCPDGVDLSDYSFFADHWRDENCGLTNHCDKTDLDFSGAIDWRDLNILCDHWLEGTGQ